MSLRLISILTVLGMVVAGCRPSPLYQGPEGEIDAVPISVAYQSSDFIEAETLPPVNEPTDLDATINEEAIIGQAMAAHNNREHYVSSKDETAIIHQAVATQNAMDRGNPFASFHRVRHVPEVVMNEIRPHQPYFLDSGDRVRVLIYGQPNLSRIYNIDDGGFISVPLIGLVRARNTTTYDLEKSIADLLAARYVKDPKVSVEISQYRPFFILGEVRRAGQYPFVSSMTVQTAVAIAGGFSERAYEESVTLTRTVNGYRAVVKVAPDEPVYPGDTIQVRERFF